VKLPGLVIGQKSEMITKNKPIESIFGVSLTETSRQEEKERLKVGFLFENLVNKESESLFSHTGKSRSPWIENESYVNVQD
jgi:hypothetical protein